VTPEDRIKKLVQLSAECHRCNGCSLHNNNPPVPGWIKGPYVFGTGKVTARLMIVGQNPGIKEVQKQRPFVGPAGEKLNEAIGSVGLSRDDLYITNSVLCYTMSNAVPPEDSIVACKSFLRAQIETVEPDVVVCCGASASRSFGSKYKYSTDFCKSPRIIETDLHPRVIMTVHPAYVIYKHEEAMKILKAGLDRAKIFLDKGE